MWYQIKLSKKIVTKTNDSEVLTMANLCLSVSLSHSLLQFFFSLYLIPFLLISTSLSLSLSLTHTHTHTHTHTFTSACKRACIDFRVHLFFSIFLIYPRLKLDTNNRSFFSDMSNEKTWFTFFFSILERNVNVIHKFYFVGFVIRLF